jgi:hypothetical protein
MIESKFPYFPSPRWGEGGARRGTRWEDEGEPVNQLQDLNPLTFPTLACWALAGSPSPPRGEEKWKLTARRKYFALKAEHKFVLLIEPFIH